MTYKELKKENEELSKKLNMANKTVHDLIMQEVELLRELAIGEINRQHDHYESQVQVTDGKIKRINTIIDFLYMRGRN